MDSYHLLEFADQEEESNWPGWNPGACVRRGPGAGAGVPLPADRPEALQVEPAGVVLLEAVREVLA